MIQDNVIREKQYRRNINSKGNTRYYDDSCKTIREYAKEQNTVYDPMTNQILYGINSNMHVSGVSDGTCNQINPLLFVILINSSKASGLTCPNVNVPTQNTESNLLSSYINFLFKSILSKDL